MTVSGIGQRTRGRYGVPALLAMLVLLSAACTHTQSHRFAGLHAGDAIGRGASVVLIEPDIELSELLASGVMEPRADWTQAARTHVEEALREILSRREVTVRPFVADATPELEEQQRQLTLLHRAVGTSILLYRYVGTGLPHKNGAFDWTLGPGARALDADARYGLFVYLRDSHATAGRKAMLALMLVGIGVSLGEQAGFASLVDLNDGRVIWFNVMTAATGDLRNPEDAQVAVSKLLDGIPL